METKIQYPLKPLTLVTGLNGSGKSTWLQKVFDNLPDEVNLLRIAVDRNPSYLGSLAEGSSLLVEIKSPQLQKDPRSNLLSLQLEAWIKAVIPSAPWHSLSPEGRRLPGKGVKSIWPVILTALSTPIGSVLYVENPELSLHPSGQSVIGDFLCRIAASGVSVVLETHSDHVFNAARLAVKSKMLKPEEVDTYFFSVTGEDEPTFSVEILSMDKNGKIPHWPKGFFDQFDTSLDQLLEP